MNYTTNTELVEWLYRQVELPTKYELGGIGRYQNGYRFFDCVGLIKCFLWHDYPNNGGSYYNVTCPDKSSRQMYAEATHKGLIQDIPEIVGLIVHLDYGDTHSHTGIYIGNGRVIEATPSFKGGVQITKIGDRKKDWQYWYFSPYLVYEGVNMKEGYSTGTFNGVKYHNYKQAENEKVYNWKIDKPLSLANWGVKSSCIVGGSNYFVNVSGADYGQILGRVQDKEHKVDDAPNKDGFLDWVWDKGQVQVADMNSWDWRGADFGASPYAVIIQDGRSIKMESSAIPTKWNSKKTQTIFGLLTDGKFACTVVENGVTCDMARELAKALGYHDACLGDSGGSSIMYVNGVYKTPDHSRKLPIAFVFQKEEGDDDMKIRMKATKEVVVLREKMTFNSLNKPNGTILAKLQKGETAEVKAFYPIQRDGYQWLGVTYKGMDGYMQYDSKCYELEEF